MNELWAKVDMFGSLNIQEIFFFYDEPQIFSCVSRFGQIYLIMLTDMDQRKWLAVPISSARLALLKKNRISVKQAFIDAEDEFVWMLHETAIGKVSAIQQLCSNIEDEDLPDDDVFLDYEQDDVMPTNIDDISIKSIQERRDIVDLSLLPHLGHTREIDSEILGETLINAQQLFYALSLPLEHTSGRISIQNKENNKIVAVGCYAASFGIRLMSSELADLYGKTKVTDTIKMFSELLIEKDNQDKLRKVLKQHSPLATIRYRKFIASLYRSDLEVKISLASPNNYVFHTKFNKDDIKRNLKFLEDEISDMTISETMIGTLVGINVEKNTFAFKSTNDENIIGTLSDVFVGKTFEVPRMVEAVFDKKITWNESTQKERCNYVLKEINVDM